MATVEVRVRLDPALLRGAPVVRVADAVRARVGPTVAVLDDGLALDVTVAADERLPAGELAAAVDGRPAVTSAEFHRPSPDGGVTGEDTAEGTAGVAAEVAHLAVLDALVRGPSAPLVGSGRGARCSCALGLSPDHLDELIAATDDLAASLTELRGRLDAELGLATPPLDVELDATVPPGTFTLRVGDVLVSRRAALRGDELFVALDPEAVAATGTPARPMVDPVDGSLGAVVDPASVTDRLASHEQGPVAYDAVGHLGRWVVEDLRRWAALLVDDDAAAQWLDTWAMAQPALVDMVRDLVPTSRVAAVLRALLADGAGVADGAALLGALAEHVRSDADVLDRLDDLRASMGRALVGRSCDSSGVLTAAVLPDDGNGGPAPLPEQPAVDPPAGALQRLAALDPDVPVLVPAPLRRAMADALRFAQPRRTVLSVAEVPAHLAVRTVAPR